MLKCVTVCCNWCSLLQLTLVCFLRVPYGVAIIGSLPTLLGLLMKEASFCGAVWCMTVSCSVLQYVAVCCSVMTCVVVRCIVLQCVAVCCSVLQCVAVCCSALQCNAVYCSVLPVALCCSTPIDSEVSKHISTLHLLLCQKIIISMKKKINM